MTARIEPNGHRILPAAGAQTRWAANRALRISDGTWQPFVDHAPVVDHVRALRAAGISVQAIADMAGVALSQIQALAYDGTIGRTRTWGIRPSTAQAILAVTPSMDAVPDNYWIDATGTQRRLRALQRSGWPLTHVADRLGVSVQYIDSLCKPSRKVTAGTAKKIRAIYRELTLQSGPSKRIRRRAELKGYPGPGAWTDIDDPTETPQPETDQQMTPEERLAEIEFLTDQGVSLERIAESLGRDAKSVAHYLRRYERHDLLERLQRRAA